MYNSYDSDCQAAAEVMVVFIKLGYFTWSAVDWKRSISMNYLFFLYLLLLKIMTNGGCLY